MMRYVNGSNFVEIVDGMSSDYTDTSVEVWFVETDLSVLPGELGGRVQKTDPEGFEKLKMALSSWAETHEYVRVPD